MFRPSLATVAVLLVLGMLGTVALGATQRARESRQAAVAQAAPAPAAPPLEPLGEVDPRPVPPQPPPTSILSVRDGRALALRARPGGPVVEDVAATTEFGSATKLPVAAERGGWVGVTSTELPNGKVGWVRREDPAVAGERRTRLAIRVDLSERRLRLMAGRRVLTRAEVGIGRPGSPTPTGRFAVTDKLDGSRYGPYYGCCILALSGHQPNLPPGWPGGDRLAIHGTSNPAAIGTRGSAGCLTAGASPLRALMRRVPLGTPVYIRR